MLLKFLLTGTLLGFGVTAVQAQTVPSNSVPTTTAQVQPSEDQILNACLQNQAQTLPNPYTDVPADHWAYKSVLTLYYCGAFGPGTPPEIFRQWRSEQTTEPSTGVIPLETAQ